MFVPLRALAPTLATMPTRLQPGHKHIPPLLSSPSRLRKCVVAAHNEQRLICFILAWEAPMPKTLSMKGSHNCFGSL